MVSKEMVKRPAGILPWLSDKCFDKIFPGEGIESPSSRFLIQLIYKEFILPLPLSVTPSHQHRVDTLEKEPHKSRRVQHPR